MFSYGFFCVTYCRTAGNFLFTVPCVSFRLIRNTGFWPVSFWRGDLRRRTEISQPPDYRTYSPEVTSLRSNLPVHRIANAPGCVVPVTRVLAYNKGKIPLCQGDFSILFTKFFIDFCAFCRRLCIAQTAPVPRRCSRRRVAPCLRLPGHYSSVFTVPTNSGTLLLSKITNRNGLSSSISTVGGTSIMAESAQTSSV